MKLIPNHTYLKTDFTERRYPMNAIPMGRRREVFWDNDLIDPALTTAPLRLIPPTEKERVFVFDREEETAEVSYPNVVRDETGYKMYYLSFDPAVPGRRKIRLRVIESTDGIHWTRPDLGLFPTDIPGPDNVVIDDFDDSSLCVFYDSNPDCPPDARYKALTLVFLDRAADRRSLWCWLSPDGYHFKKGYMLSDEGRFDSLNATFWLDGRYYSYIRNLHGSWEQGIVRDVRVMESEDFVHWTTPVPLSYDDGLDFQMYTNNVMPYPRAPHIRIGMPSRYVERKTWTKNDDQFASIAFKKRAAETIEPRCALAVTDLVFMCSRDGRNFHRFPEAFLTPGPETEINWLYGNCFASWPLVETGGTYSFYINKNAMAADSPKELYRYEVRYDGFACRIAEGTETFLVTKPLIYEGSTLRLNMATSAFGHIYVEVLDEENRLLSPGESVEIYGDATDRAVYFPDGSNFSAYAGRPVKLRFRMLDAKLFSMIFTDEPTP